MKLFKPRTKKQPGYTIKQFEKAVARMIRDYYGKTYLDRKMRKLVYLDIDTISIDSDSNKDGDIVTIKAFVNKRDKK